MERVSNTAEIRKRLPLMAAVLAFAFLPSSRIVEPSRSTSSPAAKLAAVSAQEAPQPTSSSSSPSGCEVIVFGTDAEGNPVVQRPEDFGIECKTTENQPMPQKLPLIPDPTLA